MSENKRWRVLRAFSEPDHENGVDLQFSPDGDARANPAKRPCSVYTGEPKERWYTEEVPDFQFTNSAGAVVTRHLPAGGDGAGPLLVPMDDDEPDGAPAQSATKQDWVDWSVSQGADPDTANAASKNDLIALYGDNSGKGTQ